MFEENGVDGLQLLALTRVDLEEGMGIGNTDVMALVMKAIKNLQKMTQDSPIFIDHDPYCFGKILDQLRLKVMAKENYKPLSLSDIKKSKQNTFEKTVDYYFPGVLRELILKKHVTESSILSQAQVGIINNWLNEDACDSDIKLLYRASRDGWQLPRFHDKCNNQGPTLTVVCSTGGFIFGGFCDTPWSCESGYKASPKAFLFTIKCYSGLAPTKMKLKEEKLEKAVYHSRSYGPSFGDDLNVRCEVDSNSKGDTSIGECYELPRGQKGDTFLTGSQYFDALEVEVFSVQ
eukprot:1041749-Ditylum_brightwellii.AAC.1